MWNVRTIRSFMFVLAALVLMPGFAPHARAQFSGLPTGERERVPQGLVRDPAAQPQALMPATVVPSPFPAGATSVQEGLLSEVQSERSAHVALEQPVDPESYRCGPGDVFEVRFWGQENFSMNLTVDLEGKAFVPRLGPFVAAGQTLAALRSAMRDKARRQYPGLSFDLSLRKPRTFVVHVSEDVKRPGPYEAHALERVSEVLERAGTSPARRNVVIRHRDGKESRADLLLYERSGDTRHNPILSDGDIVRVLPPALVASITGAVRYPGRYELVEGKDLAELLALAGGTLTTAAKNLPMRLTRLDEHERASAQDIAWDPKGGMPEVALHDEDAVTVRDAGELQRTVLLQGPVEGADALDGATAVRRVPYVEGDTVRSIVERAGGIKAPGDLKGAYIARTYQDGRSELIPIDLEALLARRDFSADRPVLVGDEIVVPAVRHGVLVQGAVARPGLYAYNPKFGISEFIAHAGGPTRNARSIGSVSVVRPNGKTVPYEKGMRIGPGDALIVPERNFSRAEIVSLVIAGGGLVISALTLGLVASQ